MHPNLARAIDALADVGEAQAVQAQSTSASAAPTATAEADGSSSSAEPLPHQYRAQQYALAEPPAGSNAAEIPLSVGVALPFCAQLLPTLHDATAAYFDFVTLPLVGTHRDIKTHHVNACESGSCILLLACAHSRHCFSFVLCALRVALLPLQAASMSWLSPLQTR